jgi:hypothetical protein
MTEGKVTRAGIQSDGYEWEISLRKLVGKPIADIWGMTADEFGEPSFKLTRVVFEDGTTLDVEGEHDFPYLVEGNAAQPNFNEETLRRLYEEEG